jgi:hypothetical protein
VKSRFAGCVAVFALVLSSSVACTGKKSDRPGGSSPASEGQFRIERLADGIPGWTGTGEVETYTKEGLYGYMDGGAEIVLPYGFRELSVVRFVPATGETRELVLEIYRMASGEDAFGLYSTKLEGGETGVPGTRCDSWIAAGQASLVKGEHLVNVMAPDATEREIAAFTAALEPEIPGEGTVRPKGMDLLPREGMIPSSGRYLKGPVAARNESPFLEGDFGGFGGAEAGKGGTVAFSAKYGAYPSISKLIVVEFARAPEADSLENTVLASFKEYLQDVRSESGVIEGRSEAGRFFFFKTAGRLAALVLGDPDRDGARARLDIALSRVPG